LNHSHEYHAAVLAAFAEFILESLLVPGLKQWSGFKTTMAYLAFFFQFIRTLAMLTAGSNFNHIVQEHKHQGHVLVKSGVYSILRHPAYTGFFYWALSLQLMLGNPICCVIYVVVLSKFFSARIQDEEAALIQFFGKEYQEYQQNTFILIPFL
jgi:protein-S-isoprenylcysteine O-methyltransferase